MWYGNLLCLLGGHENLFDRVEGTKIYPLEGCIIKLFLDHSRYRTVSVRTIRALDSIILCGGGGGVKIS